MGLVEIIRLFIEHRRDVVLRRTRFELRKAREREHILTGYQVALDHLDTVIRIIRGSASRAEAKENLLKFFSETDVTINEAGKSKKIEGVKLDGRKYKLGGIEGETARTVTAGGLTPVQVDAILELQLHRLTQLSVDEILKELKAIRERIAELEEILASDKKLKSVIVAELRDVQKTYGDDRRTQIVDKVDEIKLEDLIADTEMLITVSHAGYIKRTSTDTYRHQSRGGKGRIGAKTREEDFVEHLFVASAHSYILLFTSKGRVYWLKVYEIPDLSAAGKGKHVGNLVGLQPGETVKTMLAVRNLEEENKYIFFATRNGLVKKSEVREFMHVRSNGIMAIGIEQGDELVAARITNGNQIVFLASHEGMAVRFDESHVRPMGRAAYGVWGIDLEKGDYVIGMATTLKPGAPAATKEKAEGEPEVVDVTVKGDLILSVTENGFGKRTPADEYRLTNRGGKGVINLKTTERVGKVVSIAQVDEKSEVMLISHYGKIIRMDSGTIRESGRNAQGVRLLNMEPGDKVAAAVVIAPEEEGNGNGGLIQ